MRQPPNGGGLGVRDGRLEFLVLGRQRRDPLEQTVSVGPPGVHADCSTWRSRLSAFPACSSSPSTRCSLASIASFISEPSALENLTERSRKMGGKSVSRRNGGLIQDVAQFQELSLGLGCLLFRTWFGVRCFLKRQPRSLRTR